MSNAWPSVPLGEVLVKSDDLVDLVPTQQYKEVTIRLWGKGVVLRGVVAGSEIAAGRRVRIKTGQFIVSRIDARNGALGVVPDELDGAVVSNDFPTYNPVESRLAPDYLNWLSKTAQFVDLCRAASEGTTNRVRLQEARFLAMSVPLPPFAEQRRIVAKIEQLASKIEEARRLKGSAHREVDLLRRASVGQVFDALSEETQPTKFGQFNPHVTSGPRHWNQYYTSSGYRIYRAQDIGCDGEILDDSKVFVTPPNGNQGRHALLSPGDLLIVITGAPSGDARCLPTIENRDSSVSMSQSAGCRTAS